MSHGLVLYVMWTLPSIVQFELSEHFQFDLIFSVKRSSFIHGDSLLQGSHGSGNIREIMEFEHSLFQTGKIKEFDVFVNVPVVREYGNKI